MATETYSIATDFGGNFSQAQFHCEVEMDATLGPKFDDEVRVEGDVVTIEFTSALTAPEKVILDALVAAHVPGEGACAGVGGPAGGGGGEFTGDNYIFKNRLTVQSTVSDVFQDYLILDASGMVDGFWRIAWFYLWSQSSANKPIELRLQVDAVDAATPHFHKTASNVDASRVPAYQFATKELTAGDHTFILWFRAPAGGTSFVFEGRLEVQRVDAS